MTDQATVPSPAATRSPVVHVRLCPPCGGYQPFTPEDYFGALSGPCQGCGAHVRETHRFPAVIDSAGECSCTTAHPRVTGDLSPATLEGMLREFHGSKAIHGCWMPDKPTADIPDWIRTLRWRLLSEELRELSDADAVGDIVKIADGIADVIYVLAGTAVVHGIPLDAMLAEVHRSNMTKHNTPDEAKLVKGPDYEPPDIAGVLGLVKEAGDE